MCEVPGQAPRGALLDEVVDDGVEAAGLGVDGELPVGARALAEDGADALEVVLRLEDLGRLRDELEDLPDQRADRDLLLLAEVDELAVEPVAHRAPLVLLDQRARVLAEREVAAVEQVELAHQRLDERRDGDGVVDARRHVADADLDGVEEGMGPHVPPDLLGVVDTARLHEQVDVALEGGVRSEGAGDARAGEALEDLAPDALEAAVAAEPEGRARREGEDVGEEVADLVGQGHGRVAVPDPHVDVEAEDQVGACDVLQILDDVLVAGAVGDVLLLPVAEGVGAGGDDAQAVALGEVPQRAAQLRDLRAGLLDVAADAGARLHDGLVHLGADALAQDRVILPVLEELAHVRAQIARLGVHDLELFFDAQRELAVEEALRCRHLWSLRDAFAAPATVAGPGTQPPC